MAGLHAATVKAKHHVRDYALQRGLLESAAAAATEMEEHRGHLRNMYGRTEGRANDQRRPPTAERN